MKKTCYVFSILFFLACNNTQNQNNQITTTATVEARGTQISDDSIKPPIIVEAGVPTTVQIPTKTGSFYIKQFNDGDKKIDLIPSPTYPLALGVAQGTSNFTTFTTDQGLALDAIGCSIKDSKGNLWFGTYGGGVSRYDGKSFTNFTTAQGLANNSLRSITQDSQGNLWFGTYGGGVSRYDGQSFSNFTTAQGLANNNVASSTQDSKGNLWFGTYGGGVSRYDGKSFTNFTTAQGLANNNVLSITQDS
ncbi:MAG: hypothetical protein NT084_02850, partial [Bacteroidetes bacterium]|nr:hypothetical protein [Bacteroidota bacterium]